MLEPAAQPKKEYSFDGIRLGDNYAQVLSRAPYDKPCDDDAVDSGARRFMVYGAVPCRGNMFPEQTTVAFYLEFAEQQRFEQPIEAIAWLGGNYFKKRSTFPVGVGIPYAEARAALGADIGSKTISRKGDGLTVFEHPNHVYSLVDDGNVVGYVVGPMPGDGQNEQWRGLLEMYQRYTRPPGATPIAPCCEALKQHTLSAPPPQKGHYVAGYGACMAMLHAPPSKVVITSLHALLGGAPVPAACQL